MSDGLRPPHGPALRRRARAAATAPRSAVGARALPGARRRHRRGSCWTASRGPGARRRLRAGAPSARAGRRGVSSRSGSTSRRSPWSSPSAVAGARSSATSSANCPGSGTWRTALLLDGNIGIGGSPGAPARTHRRGCSMHAGEVLVELDAARRRRRGATLARLEHGDAGQRLVCRGRASPRPRSTPIAARRRVCRRRDAGRRSGRWFARLRRDAPRPDTTAATGPPLPARYRDTVAVLQAARDHQDRRPRARPPRRVLDGVALERRRRARWSRCSGARARGKSTLLHLLGGLDRPDAGEIVLAGQRSDRAQRHARLARRRLRHVGFVFQSFHLIEELSGAENVLLPARLPGAPAGGRAASAAADRGAWA